MKNLILLWITVTVLGFTGLSDATAGAEENDAFIHHDLLAVPALSSNSDMEIFSRSVFPQSKKYAQSNSERLCVSDCSAESNHCTVSCLNQEQLGTPEYQTCFNGCQNDYMLCLNSCR